MQSTSLARYNHAEHDQKSHGSWAHSIAKGLGYGVRAKSDETGFALSEEFGKIEVSLVQQRSRAKWDYAHAQTYIKKTDGSGKLLGAMTKLTKQDSITKAKEAWDFYLDDLKKSAERALQVNMLLNHLGGGHDQKSHGSWASKSTQLGDCYESACKKILDDPFFGGDDTKLVHAEVTGQGRMEGKKFGHAWLEKTEMIDGSKIGIKEPVPMTTVYDFANGNEIILPKEVYYAIGGVSNKKGKWVSYTKEEARRKVLDTEIWGHWEELDVDL